MRGGRNAADQAKRRILAYWRQSNSPRRFDRTPRIKRSLVWCRGTELNCRHQPFQGCALPTELPRHGRHDNKQAPIVSSKPGACVTAVDSREYAQRGKGRDEREEKTLQDARTPTWTWAGEHVQVTAVLVCCGACETARPRPAMAMMNGKQVPTSERPTGLAKNVRAFHRPRRRRADGMAHVRDGDAGLGPGPAA